MKKIILIVSLSIASAVSAQASDHRHNDIRGVIVGAGGGALLGQVIGRNTQSTVVGTAIGSVVGYLVGTEMDKREVYSTNVVYRQNQPVRYEYYEPVARYNHSPGWQKAAPRGNCREAEILGTINGRAKKMYGTVCKTPQGWQLVSQDDAYYNDYRKKGNWHKPKGRKDRHSREYRNSRWVKHRF